MIRKLRGVRFIQRALSEVGSVSDGRARADTASALVNNGTGIAGFSFYKLLYPCRLPVRDRYGSDEEWRKVHLCFLEHAIYKLQQHPLEGLSRKKHTLRSKLVVAR